MPVDTGLTKPLLVKYFHQGKSDKWIADQFHITVQAVSERRVKLGLVRKPVSRQVNDYLATRWNIWSPKEGAGHHNAHSAKALKVWLRLRLGDPNLSDRQKEIAQMWENRLRDRDVVLCYDPDPKKGWSYRPRTSRDGRRVIDWPEDLPFPDEKFKRALELP